MKDEFERLVNRFSREWQDEAKKALNRLYELLQKGKKLDVAVDILQSEYPALFSLPELKPTLVEAACYGYGIAPKVLTAAMFADWEADLSQAWASDNMKLSKRLHTASLEMRNKIIDTLRTQMKKNAAWIDTARALFDGYNADKVINEQDLPKYLKAVRDATQGSQTQLSAARKAIRNIERLSKTGSTNSLKTAYKQLVKAATTGTEEQLKKACWVAVQEKSRYVAERIARTEMSRAYADGFFRSVADDDDVVAVRWFLGTGHPVFDICDMYMKADMFGLGEGVYPKDKTPPLPAHPFCLCRLSKVYVLDKKPVDRIRKSGDKWLQGLSNVHQNMVLGIDGAEAWRNGEDWRKYMRSWQGFGQAGTRLRSYKTELSYRQGVGSPVCNLEYINSEAYRRKFDGLTTDKNLNQEVYKRCKAMLIHQSGDYYEDLCIMTADGETLVGLTSGKEKYKTLYTTKLEADIKKYSRNNLISIHNHGTNLPPSGADLNSSGYRGYKFGVIACHDGKVFYYSTQNAKAFSGVLYDKTVADLTEMVYNFDRYKAMIATLERFAKDYGLEWRELK